MFSISFVSRETGISTATLRKWEQRYDFPKPRRENGYNRLYSDLELSYLREVKRLLDQGAKPSELLTGKAEQILQLTHNQSEQDKNKPAVFINKALELMINHKMKELRVLLEKKLKKIGVFAFVEEIAAPLTIAVGEHWANGTISIFTERCYSEQMYALLTAVVKAGLPGNDTPIILLTTLSGERHTLGLAMIQALLFEQGACCINLGAELPILEIPKAVSHYQANIVGLSFSASYPKRAIVSTLAELRASLPADITVWIGGTGVKKLNIIPAGVQIITSATEVVTAYTNYKEHFKTLKKTS
jgi:DNA-binding transcriptional MerR regulator/methylmalonyl-CoA mutase cobalamin-binding subunit